MLPSYIAPFGSSGHTAVSSDNGQNIHGTSRNPGGNYQAAAETRTNETAYNVPQFTHDGQRVTQQRMRNHHVNDQRPLTAVETSELYLQVEPPLTNVPQFDPQFKCTKKKISELSPSTWTSSSVSIGNICIFEQLSASPGCTR